VLASVEMLLKEVTIMKKEGAIMKKIIRVKGMTCKSCEMLIKEEVEELEGVKSCDVSQKRGEAVVEYDENMVKIDKIIDTIKEEGYEVA